ncbi:MAG: PAS domain-containing sensor histidine kinase [Bacteroidales bacterium]|nr:PAS domain-containing sensor histidine kinase [Bacteroidales bacterium]
MTKPHLPVHEEKKLYIPVVILILVIITICLICLTGFVWNSSREIESIGSRYTRLRELTAEIDRYDELLTMSARMATATGDTSWETSYRDAEPLFDSVIREAMKTGNEFVIHAALIKTEAAKKAMVVIEHRSFRFVREGKLRDANLLLSGKEYASYKKAAKNGLSSITQMIKKGMIQKLRQQRRLTTVAFVLQFLITLSLLVVWFITIRLRGRYDAMREEKERNFRENEERVRAILESIGEGILVVDMQDKVSHFNTLFLKMWNIPPEVIATGEKKALLTSIMDRLEDPDEFIQKSVDVFESTEIGKDIIKLKDGRFFDRLIHPWHLEGQVIGRIWAFRDVTIRKKLEIQLFESESLLRETQKIAKVGGWSYDIPSGISTFTEGVYQICGVKSPTPIEWATYYGPKERSLISASVAKTMETGEPFDLELKFITAQGENRWGNTQGRAIIENGKIIKVIGNLIDITEKKEAELEIRNKHEELRELNASKDKLFSIIAHDLRSPFNSLLGFSEILADPSEKLTMEEMRKFAGNIHILLRNQFELLQNLLVWSRFQIIGIVLTPRTLNLRVLVDEMYDKLAGNFYKKQLVFTNEIAPACMVIADEDLLNSVFLNLMTNAIKFTKTGGTIRISARDIPGYKEICVRDTGIGIDPSRFPRIFRLDMVLSTPGTAGEKGTGLGLQLCKEFIEKQGGKIWVESKPGEGSAFYFTLPDDRPNEHGK